MIFLRYPEIETAVETSSKVLWNVHQPFSRAARSVLLPTSPLLSFKSGKPTEKLIFALKMIFRVIDLDRDQCLNSLEFYKFQKACFESILDEKNVKTILQSIPDSMSEKGIRLNGFIHLIHFLLKNCDLALVWNMLHKFYFTQKLKWSIFDQLQEVILDPIIETINSNNPQIRFSILPISSRSLIIKHLSKIHVDELLQQLRNNYMSGFSEILKILPPEETANDRETKEILAMNDGILTVGLFLTGTAIVFWELF